MSVTNKKIAITRNAVYLRLRRVFEKKNQILIRQRKTCGNDENWSAVDLETGEVVEEYHDDLEAMAVRFGVLSPWEEVEQ